MDAGNASRQSRVIPPPSANRSPSRTSAKSQRNAAATCNRPLLLHHDPDVPLLGDQGETGGLALSAEDQAEHAVSDPEIAQLDLVQPARQMRLVDRKKVLVSQRRDSQHRLEQEERRSRGPGLG